MEPEMAGTTDEQPIDLVALVFPDSTAIRDLRTWFRLVAVKEGADPNDASDLAQQAVAQLLTLLRSGQVKSDHNLTDPEQRRRWAREVLRFVLLRYWSRRSSPEPLVASPVAPDETPGTALNRKLIERRVQTALQSLEPRLREVVRMRIEEDFSWTEIGRCLGVTDVWAHRLYDRAVAELIASLADLDPHA